MVVRMVLVMLVGVPVAMIRMVPVVLVAPVGVAVVAVPRLVLATVTMFAEAASDERGEDEDRGEPGHGVS